MPQRSARAKLLHAYAQFLDYRFAALHRRLIYDIDDPQEEATDSALLARYHQLLHTRYVSIRVQVSRKPRFGHFMRECSDREFQRSFRVERYSFCRLVELTQDHPIFESGDSYKHMAPRAAQLLVFLKYIGTLGSDACIEEIGQFFNVSAGVCYNYIERVSRALEQLYDNVVYWPERQERREIAHRVQDGFDFPNCIGLVDGALLPLAFKPTLDGEDYFTRKGGYAINALLICDDRARVTYALAGWPGSTHDNRVWSNSAICTKPELYFSNKQ
uniref:DDE Tnp4 domain-containing protein n=1 Tax=Phytophthora fragariae TaxID=53985 RepID=A0A6A3DDC4_9STRA|nr:hypothetical protein PF009_g31407 [Phytophthora fragariae]